MYVTVTKRLQEKLPASAKDRSCLAVLDWGSKRVLDRHWIEVTRGEAGGQSRGCRGIVWHDGAIYIALHPDILQRRHPDTLGVEWESKIPGLREVHQLQSRDGELLVVSTGTNELLHMRNHEVIKVESVLTPHVVHHYAHTHLLGEEGAQDKLHFNSIGWSPDGRPHYLFAECDVLYDVYEHRAAWFGRPLRQPHDVCFVSQDVVLVNSSANRSMVLLDLARRTYRYMYHDERTPPSQDVRVALVGWTRGLALDGHVAFVGVAPGEVVAVNWKTDTVVGRLPISSDPRDAPFQLLLDPRDWK